MQFLRRPQPMACRPLRVQGPQFENLWLNYEIITLLFSLYIMAPMMWVLFIVNVKNAGLESHLIIEVTKLNQI